MTGVQTCALPIYMVEIDVIKNVGPLHQQVERDASIAIDEERLLETQIKRREAGAAVVVARREERHGVIVVQRLAGNEFVDQARSAHRERQPAVHGQLWRKRNVRKDAGEEVALTRFEWQFIYRIGDEDVWHVED